MAIVFACKCRKKLTARDELAGRKMKCSSCGAVVPIPAAKAKSATAKVATAKAPARQLVAVGARELPLARPVAPPAGDDDSPPKESATPPRPQLPALWDTSQEQHATPWARGDKARFGPPPESEGSMVIVALLLLGLAAAGGGAAWYYLA